MRKTLSALAVAVMSAAGVAGVATLLTTRASAQQGIQDISDAALQQISAIAAMKDAFTPAQQKIEASLVFAAQAAGGALAGTAVADVPSVSAVASQGNVLVDIRGVVSDALLATIASANGVVVSQFPQWGMVRASLPLASLEIVAASDDVRGIRSAARARNNVGAVTSQGYISHRANQVVGMGITGAGVTVGVLSDSASPAGIAALVASGDLPANTTVLPGQSGVPGTDEGTAMMEIVHDIAPGASLIFATAFDGTASFAQNILDLRAAGASVIVDDVTYFGEGAFQDDIIARAVNQVTAEGAIYFSSAANSGSLTFGTSGTWEGDFLPNGAAGAPLAGAGIVHNFGTVAAPQNFDRLTVATDLISLQWADPLGGSSNDYDLFVLNSTGTSVLAFSTDLQNGTQDPVELVFTTTGTFAAGDRIVVVKHAGAARALRVDTDRGQLSPRTAGSTYGHNAGANTVSTAATYWNSARTGTRPFAGATNPNEPFSSDGPRKIFYNPDGTAITPGNFLFATNGGTTLAKPDIAAADGISTKTPGFFPFFGTSAAAPHAAAIAALVLSVRPGWTPAEVLTALKTTALDSMAPGIDRDSGAGIAMALPAVQYALTH